ncbi:MAG TPA: RNA methyltransferase [Syntrophomonadaceae bacterium]|nr:RNA methyltransferase [Syntrophomonadaceae bacterium]
MVTGLKQAVQFARSLKKRKVREAEHRFIIEGISFVEEALKSGIHLDYLICTERGLQREKGRSVIEHPRRANIPLYIVEQRIFEKIAETETPQGILAVGRMPVWTEEGILQKSEGIWLVLDAIQDPGNLGTILRTAEAVGVKAVFLGEGTVDLYNSKVLRATMGSVFRVPTFSRVNLKELLCRMKESGIFVVAADPHTGKIYYRTDLRYPGLAVVIGNEGRGISPEILALSDSRIKIPLRGKVESLNAAVATALVLYEIQRQKEL